MGQANPRWGAPRIQGELLKLGIDLCQATVAKYMVRRRQPFSQTWPTFLRNHIGQIVAADFFVVPTAAWTAQQLREAFPWDETPRYLIHDRDHAFDGLRATAEAMGIEEVLTAPHAPWQNAFVERFVGSARRECLDHVIVSAAPPTAPRSTHCGIRRRIRAAGHDLSQGRGRMICQSQLPSGGAATAIPCTGIATSLAPPISPWPRAPAGIVIDATVVRVAAANSRWSGANISRAIRVWFNDRLSDPCLDGRHTVPQTLSSIPRADSLLAVTRTGQHDNSAGGVLSTARVHCRRRVRVPMGPTMTGPERPKEGGWIPRQLILPSSPSFH
jgi:hypothetical protein